MTLTSILNLYFSLNDSKRVVLYDSKRVVLNRESQNKKVTPTRVGVVLGGASRVANPTLNRSRNSSRLSRAESSGPEKII